MKGYDDQNVFTRTECCKESLKHLGEIAEEADDLRAQALHDSCRFDAFLEFGTFITRLYFVLITNNCSVGLGKEDADSLVSAAETCCTEDIYHFDETERFFLVSCLALW